MMRASAAEAAGMAGGSLAAGRGSVALRGVTIDSRKILGGELFVALAGDRFDGHDFVWKAFTAGCAAAMVSRELREGQVPPDGAVIRVDDTYEGLRRLAAAYRRRFEIPWVAITGSCGKSTTKELTATILGARGPVLKAEASFNNRVGLPLTILRASAEHRFAVLEIGANHRGEIAPLARTAAPDVAVITCVGPAHLAGLGGLEGVAEEKAALLGGLRSSGLAVLNADDDYYGFFRGRAPGPVLSFGLTEAAEVRGTDISLNPEGTEFSLPGGVRVRLPMPGVHNVRNALAAAAVGRSQGMAFDEVADRLAAAQPLHMRSRVVRLGGLLLLDDCYNANPASFLAALEALDGLGRHRKVVVAGDMAELGEHSEEHHQALGEEIAGRGVELLVTVGGEARRVSEAAARAGGVGESHSFLDAAVAAAAVPGLLRDGDAVLVKGSRSMGLEAVVAAIAARFGGGTGG